MPQAERDYLEKRRRACEQQALGASDPSVARIHRQFADHYAARLARQPRDSEPAPLTA